MITEKNIEENEMEKICSPEALLRHAEEIERKYRNSPAYAAFYLKELLNNCGYVTSSEPEIEQVVQIVKHLESSNNGDNEELLKYKSLIQEKEEALNFENISREISFRKEIERYYLPKSLISAILETGEIPKTSTEQLVGIAFLDIADYTYLSKFLSPKENQIVLNGLYAAFNWVLIRHGGYLNKIEGDSIMFHFGGNIDPKVKDLTQDEAERYIAKELFYTCVEMQRVAFLFNQANDRFLYGNEDEETRDAIKKAFEIIGSLRTNSELSQAINAFFQIRIRIGANIGIVTIGNFGPDGARQWDIIGVPVIKAKRMESTAPIGGFRISEELYGILDKTGIIDEYYRRFKREAEALFGSFRAITPEELFRFSTVKLKDKRGETFKTYSVQVNPGLPEALMNQVDLLLNKEKAGVKRILQILEYYRGNRFVVNGIEEIFRERSVHLRKHELFNLMFPKKSAELIKTDGAQAVEELINNTYSLFDLLEMLGSLQDTVKQDMSHENNPVPFQDYDTYIKGIKESKKLANFTQEKKIYQRTYFYNYLFPTFFAHVEASILEYQQREAILTEI